MRIRPQLIASAGMWALPVASFAANPGSTAYGQGKAVGYVVGGVLLFLLARRLLGGLSWARWLVVPVIAVALFRLYPFAGNSDFSSAQIQALAASVRAGEVVMYSTTECVYCAQAKAWLQANGFAFTECNMSVEARCEREFVRLGGTGTPFLMVRGRPMSEGFDSDQFLALLSRNF